MACSLTVNPNFAANVRKFSVDLTEPTLQLHIYIYLIPALRGYFNSCAGHINQILTILGR